MDIRPLLAGVSLFALAACAAHAEKTAAVEDDSHYAFHMEHDGHHHGLSREELRELQEEMRELHREINVEVRAEMKEARAEVRAALEETRAELEELRKDGIDLDDETLAATITAEVTRALEIAEVQLEGALKQLEAEEHRLHIELKRLKDVAPVSGVHSAPKAPAAPRAPEPAKEPTDAAPADDVPEAPSAPRPIIQ